MIEYKLVLGYARNADSKGVRGTEVEFSSTEAGIAVSVGHAVGPANSTRMLRHASGSPFETRHLHLPSNVKRPRLLKLPSQHRQITSSPPSKMLVACRREGLDE